MKLKLDISSQYLRVQLAASARILHCNLDITHNLFNFRLMARTKIRVNEYNILEHLVCFLELRSFL